VVPLLVAKGAGSVGRRSLGTTVFGGMALSTVLNLFFIPVLYILIETLRERRGGRVSDEDEGGRGAGTSVIGEEATS
jgi:HAE1 family hydrophobic/amphiphilic exporter-1